MGLQERIGSKSALAIEPVAGRIGAVISGVRLGGDLDVDTVSAIRRTLLARKVVFFRGQQHLTLAEQEAFGKLFGALVAHPTVPKVDGTEVSLEIVYNDATTAANQWHADETFMEDPPLAGILRAVKLPSVGGDTMWANTATAYENMPAPLRDLADKLWALHTNMSDYGSERRHPKGRMSWAFATEQPVVRVHPETGERVLLLGFHAQKIVGLSREDSARLMNLFQDHITRPENTMRWHWSLGDVAFWDNRATQHYGIGDFNERRELNRISLAGDTPVSVDGKKAIVRKKEQFQA